VFTLWIMGRPAAGKSTLARGLADRLAASGRDVENLDGDDFRAQFHPELGFSRADRRVNNRRTAHVAKLLNRHGVVTVVGMITPFAAARELARETVEPDGEFVLVYARCSLESAEARDPKGLYADARAGEVEKFTGVDHPFEEPTDPDVVVDTERSSPAEGVSHVLDRLVELDVIGERPDA
jgi:adenylyl-sulfate kinase